VIKLQVEGGETRTVLFKDFEKDPVDGQLLHADFLEVRMDKEVVVNVPVILIGKPVGVTEGGILQQVARTLPVLCKPTDIPEKIEVDVSNLAIAQSLHPTQGAAGVSSGPGDRPSRWSTSREGGREVVKPSPFRVRSALLLFRAPLLALRVLRAPLLALRVPLLRLRALLPPAPERPPPPTRAARRASKRCASSSASATRARNTSATATTSASVSPRTQRGSWAWRST
jgi:hypothetical protein